MTAPKSSHREAPLSYRPSCIRSHLGLLSAWPCGETAHAAL